MTTLAKVRSHAKKIGATVEHQREGDSWVLRVEAPYGFVWSEGYVHEIIDASYAPWKPDYEECLSRMGFGIEKCEDHQTCQCDWCDPEWWEIDSNKGEPK